MKWRPKLIPIGIGVVLVLVAAWLQVTSHPGIRQWREALHHLAYDVQLRIMRGKPALDPDSPIVIVAVDDRSLAAQGRWPWPRNKLAALVDQLTTLGAAVIALDMSFPEPEPNIAQEILHRYPHLTKTFASILPAFDHDRQFAEALKKANTVLGVTLNTPNIPRLQTAAKGLGFVDAFPDADGILRRTLLISPPRLSLALEAIRLYTFTDQVEPIWASQGDNMVLQGIKLGEQVLLTDEKGRVLIPFRGTAYSFPYFSATDVLAKRVSPTQIQDKLVFVGATAFGLGDLHATAIQSIYPGVEVHATVAAGILENHFPTRPAWASGAEFVVVIGLGLMAVFLFPFLRIVSLTVATVLLLLTLFLVNHGLWQSKGIVLSALFPAALIVGLAIFNMAYGYLFESRRRAQLKSMFGQYVPVAHVDAMLADAAQYGFQGQSREMTVLFADIRNFTTLSEKLSAAELKELLNHYLTPMTEIIFTHHGTIDKYVGDMIMAFWNAPLADAQHAQHAVLAALEMQLATSLPIGIGINSGMMHVGDMGSTFRRAYTVLGDAVNLASRLEGQTKHYGVKIIVGEATYRQTKADILYRQLDRIKVKGKETAVAIYQPLCVFSEASEALKRQVGLHEEALKAYFNQQWEVAERGLKEAVYVNRIAAFRKTPPPPDWDGVYESQEK